MTTIDPHTSISGAQWGDDVPSPPETVMALREAWRQWQNELDFPFTPDHCINGTRVAVTALGKFGIRARPVAVQLIIFNRPAHELHRAGVPVADWPEHAWSIGVNGEDDDRPGHWNGHLVCEGDEWTLDMSARQFHRPGLIIVNEPFLFPHRLDPTEQTVFADDAQQVVVMWRHPSNNRWRHSPGWKKPHAAIVAELVARTKALLGG